MIYDRALRLREENFHCTILFHWRRTVFVGACSRLTFLFERQFLCVWIQVFVWNQVICFRFKNISTIPERICRHVYQTRSPGLIRSPCKSSLQDNLFCLVWNFKHRTLSSLPRCAPPYEPREVSVVISASIPAGVLVPIDVQGLLCHWAWSQRSHPMVTMTTRTGVGCEKLMLI